MQLGHTSIQVQQWPVNAPLSASRAGIIKIPSVYTENSRKGRRGAIPSRGVHISRISGLHSPSKGTPDAGDDKVGPLFLAPASSLPTSQQAQGTKAAPSSSPPHGPPRGDAPCPSCGSGVLLPPLRCGQHQGMAKLLKGSFRSSANGAWLPNTISKEGRKLQEDTQRAPTAMAQTRGAPTYLHDPAEDGGVVHRAAVPPALPKLVLALLDGAAGPLADEHHVLLVELAQLALPGGQPRQLAADGLGADDVHLGPLDGVHGQRPAGREGRPTGGCRGRPQHLSPAKLPKAGRVSAVSCLPPCCARQEPCSGGEHGLLPNPN